MASGKTILVVDDDSNLRQTLVLILRSAGYEVEFAENAPKGMIQLQGRPEIDGLKLLKTVRNLHPDLPVFFLTGNGSPEVEAEARANGVMGYLVKPADPERILQLVRTLCPIMS
jgi:CheY-like chemotaxis protein